MRNTTPGTYRSPFGIALVALVLTAGCAHEQGYDIGQLGEPAVLPALDEQMHASELESDQFLQLVDRNSWPRIVVPVYRSITVTDPSYMTEASFDRQGQPWNAHPTLASAAHAEPGRSDDIRVLPAELFRGVADIVAMPFRMIIGPHPHDAIDGPAADWALLPERAAFDPGWFQPVGMSESPHPAADERDDN